VTALAERYISGEPAAIPAERLAIGPDLAAPASISPELWGSLVHAVLEARLGPTAQPLEAKLREELEEAAGGEAAARGAIERAEALAGVFLASELGLRALASSERLVELKVAIGLDETASRNAPRTAKGSVDLAFAEGDRVVVVDYKTDTAVRGGEHDLQVAAYVRAARDIFGRPAEGWVFYLYGGGIALRVEDADGAPRLEDALRSTSR
jgi:ATP-dependent exoDNAse (exonuclease V) beta subunit